MGPLGCGQRDSGTTAAGYISWSPFAPVLDGLLDAATLDFVHGTLFEILRTCNPDMVSSYGRYGRVLSAVFRGRRSESTISHSICLGIDHRVVGAAGQIGRDAET